MLLFFFKILLFLKIEVQLTFTVALVFGAQQGDSLIHTYTFFFFLNILFHYGLS